MLYVLVSIGGLWLKYNNLIKLVHVQKETNWHTEYRYALYLFFSGKKYNKYKVYECIEKRKELYKIFGMLT